MEYHSSIFRSEVSRNKDLWKGLKLETSVKNQITFLSVVNVQNSDLVKLYL